MKTSELKERQKNRREAKARTVDVVYEKKPLAMLGLDPGFANLGIVVVKLKTSKEFVKHTEVFVTKKAPPKLKVRATADNMLRTKQIAARLREVISQYRVIGIAAESMSFPRSASVAAKMAMVWGVLADISEALRIPIIEARPQDIRAALGFTPTKNETKEERKTKTQRALDKRFKKFAAMVQAAGIPKSRFEHVYDALAAVVACLRSPEIEWARSLNG